MSGWREHFDKIRLYYHNKDINCISEIAIGIESLLREYTNSSDLNFDELINYALDKFSKKENIHNIRRMHNLYKHEDGIKTLNREIEGNNFYHNYVLPTNEMIRYLESLDYKIKYFINIDFFERVAKNEKKNILKYNSGYFAFNRIFKINKEQESDTVKNPIIAVIHNILAIGPSISKSKYLENIKLNSEELEIVYQYEILLLNIICNEDLNNKLIFKSNSHYLSYLKYAIEDINYYIKLFSNITGVNIIQYELLEENEIKDERVVIFNYNKYVIQIENDFDTSYHNQFMFSKSQIKYYIDESTIDCLNELTNLIFGHNYLRDGQQKAIIDILNNSYNKKYVSLSIMPTGYGKSLVYQLISILHPVKSIVISPTKILIEDQIINAYDNNIYAFGKFEMFKLYNSSKLLYYATPSEIQDGSMYERFVEYGVSNKIGFLFFDEVHQLSIWGHRFDPNFLSLTNYIVRTLQNVTIACFTATATKKTILDLKEKIQWHDIHILEPCSMVRGNLKHSFVEKNSIDEIIDSLVECLKKDLQTDGLIMIINNDYSILNEIYLRINNDIYLSSVTQLFERYDRYEYESFRSGITRIILASDDFTIGINVKNLKKIYTIGLPCSKEWYYQETGRVCRTDENCESIVYLLKKLTTLDKNFIDLNFKNISLSDIKKNSSLMISNNSYLFNEFEIIDLVKKEMIELIDKLDAFKRTERVQYDNSYRNIKIVVDNDKYDIWNRAIYFLQIIGFVSHWNEELQNGRKYFSIFFRAYFTYQNFIKINSISFDKMKYIKQCEKAILYKDSKLLSNVFTNWFSNNVYLSKRLLLKNVYQTCKRAIDDEYFANKIEDDLYSYFMADFATSISQTRDNEVSGSLSIDNEINEISLESIKTDFININEAFTTIMFKNKYQRKYEATMQPNCIVAILLAELITKNGKFYFDIQQLKILNTEQILFIFYILKDDLNLFNMNKVIEFIEIIDLNQKLLNDIYKYNIKEINSILLLGYLNNMEA